MTSLTLPTSPYVRKKTKKKKIDEQPIDMNRVAAIILEGDKGARLFPLTTGRCKPSLYFGGPYRLVDISISNAINSGCHKIFIISHFLSSTLHQHIFKTYRLGTLSSGFIELIPAEQSSGPWIDGPADTVRHNIEYLIDAPVDYFLILEVDQLYQMNFQKLMQFARVTNADLVISSLPVGEKEAKKLGILKIDKNNTVTDFSESPHEKGILQKFKHSNRKGKSYLASMGIYLFKREVFFELLKHDPRDDFGKHLIQTKVKQGGVSAYIHDGYWENIGSIGSFYRANISMTKGATEFPSYSEDQPIFTTPNHLPGPKFIDTLIQNSIVCNGSYIAADELRHSILGPRTVVKKGTVIHDSYIMGNDFYHSPVPSDRIPEDLFIGENCIIKNAIIDNHVSIGDGVRLINRKKLNQYDGDQIYIRDGVTVVPHGAVIPDGFIL